MYTNSSIHYNSQIISKDQSIAGWDSTSSLHRLHHLYGWVKMPSMAVKAAKHQGVPDQPDRAGMRERRKQSEMTLTELQRSRGIQSPENPHTQMLDAYGYRQLADLVFSVPKLTLRALNAIGDAMTFRIGPQGADAATVSSKKSPVNKKLSVDEFVKKHTKDFEIWLSPSAKKAEDMRGMIVVIGEIHHDPSIQPCIKKLMLAFSRTQGDRFFLEGGDDLNCQQREEDYKMQSGDCRILEKDSAAYWHLRQLTEELDKKLMDCVSYLKEHIPAAQQDLEVESTSHYVDFVQRYASKLPSYAKLGFQQVYSKAEAADIRAGEEAERLMSERNRYIANRLLNDLTEARLNYVIVGADHLKGIRGHIEHRRCIFMQPRSIVEEGRSISLTADSKDEL
jgi:hypothetical protein